MCTCICCFYPQERAYRRVFRLLRTGERVAMVAIGGSMVGGAKCHDPIGTWPCRAANGCGATHELECAYVSVRLTTPLATKGSNPGTSRPC